MKSHINILHINELFPNSNKPKGIEENICCVRLMKESILKTFSKNMSISGSSSFLVISGKARILANNIPYDLTVNEMLYVYTFHSFSFIDATDNFICLAVFVGKEFMDEMDPSEMVYMRAKDSINLFRSPVIKFDDSFAEQAKGRIDAITDAINNTSHIYYKHMVLNAVIAFFLDFSNFVEHKLRLNGEDKEPRYEHISKDFFELLITSYRNEHNIDFYASKLNITAHYLTLVVKKITKQTPVEYINELLYSDARSLLINTKLSVQEVASMLNFSDQSAFGKFFKRHSGLSPLAFKKTLK